MRNMKSIFIGALTGFILSCGNSFNKEPGGIDSLKNYSSDDSIACNYDYSITEYQRVDPGYQFSDEMIYFKKNKYNPKICSYYKNDSLVSLDLFGSEGRIFYSLRDIENDTLLDKRINAKKVRKVIKTESYIIDSGEKFSISNVDGNQIFYFANNRLCVYCVAPSTAKCKHPSYQKQNIVTKTERKK